MNPASSCPTTQTLQQFVLGRVSSEELDELAAHVENCRRCIATLHGLTMQNPLGDAGPVSQTDANNLLDQLKKRLRKPAIAVCCPQCGKDLKVREELAGKKVRCPQCKRVLDVPAPEGATLAPRGPAVAPIAAHHVRDPEEDIPSDSGPTEIVETGSCFFEVSGEIARGGMGAIMRAVDQDIHREVAVKFLLNHADSHQKARFVEEAQITGQLEHPNIVPIHQLGTHKDGRCFFSMKMVKGRSLADILKQQGEPGASATGGGTTLGQLLTIFAGVCNGMAYAHSRQVIHRDLKPANIMVGDFGEVYVMDWGLAKVLGDESAVSDQQSAIKSAPTFSRDPKGSATDSKTDSKVTTNRSSTGELTQAGSIMGTPAYMSPEQAQGDPDRIDERTDIYALGAILYEILTLTPPVGRGGDIASILMRVIDGKIDAPAARAPERVKAGWIPPELSAIAMKALAKKRKDRYQTVAELQRDIQLFQEGRSVSAKQDSTWEMFKKLVKRNKGASAGVAAALLVLLGSMIFILMAWQETRNEQRARREQGKNSAPVFLADAKQSTSQKKFDNALAQVGVALDFDPALTEAWLLKGQLLIAQKKFDEAKKYLAEYVGRKPNDADAMKLVELCGRTDRDDLTVLLEFSETLSRQKAYMLAEVMMAHAGDFKDARQRLYKLYQQRLDAAWPGAGANLLIDGNGSMSLTLQPVRDLVTDLAPLHGMKLHTLSLVGCSKVADLAPLTGMPLTVLNLSLCGKVTDLTRLVGMKLTELYLHQVQVKDLAPLHGMPLTILTLNACDKIEDLTPLKDMPLTSLDLSHCAKVSDLSALQGMKLTGTLDLLNMRLVKDLAPLKGMKLTGLNLQECEKVSDLSPLRGMKLTSLILDGCHEVNDLSSIQGMQLTALDLRGCAKVRDLSPLKGMPLTSLSLHKCEKVGDLSPLQGMAFTTLDLWGCKLVHDLSPLKGMKLTFLTLNSCEQVHDLSPLQGMPLTVLDMRNCSKVTDLSPLKGMLLTVLYLDSCGQVSDISPLQGMKLTSLDFADCGVHDLSPLKGMALTHLSVRSCPVKDLTPLRGMPLTFLSLEACKFINDLTPLVGMKLEAITLPPTVTKGLEVLRNMSSLKTIDSKPAAQFWKEHDAKKTGK